MIEPYFDHKGIVLDMRGELSYIRETGSRRNPATSGECYLSVHSPSRLTLKRIRHETLRLMERRYIRRTPNYAHSPARSVSTRWTAQRAIGQAVPVNIHARKINRILPPLCRFCLEGTEGKWIYQGSTQSRNIKPLRYFVAPIREKETRVSTGCATAGAPVTLPLSTCCAAVEHRLRRN